VIQKTQHWDAIVLSALAKMNVPWTELVMQNPTDASIHVTMSTVAKALASWMIMRRTVHANPATN
jgi:hypothetical protein